MYIRRYERLIHYLSGRSAAFRGYEHVCVACFYQSSGRTYPGLSAQVLGRFRGLAGSISNANCHRGSGAFQRVETWVV
ncbi:MAG: hypothetical protein JWR14_6468 [Caballeronia sp.]|jgi:hypothetical protein|nr:hypothetical protein [Caballeronia sp.]